MKLKNNEKMKKVYVIIYAHYYDFEVYTECRVCDTEEKANERMKEYARDIYGEYADKEVADFEDWLFYNSDADGLSYDVDGCEYYNVHIEEREINKD